jgi:hypothetical protein
MNDYTQAPARDDSRSATLDVLRNYYAPLISPLTVVVFLETFAYVEEGVNNSSDLGTFDEFQDALVEGYEVYRELMDELGVKCRIAKVGSAFRRVKSADEELWRKLYFSDKYHPSPLGTFLSSCVLHRTMFGSDAVLERAGEAFVEARHMSGGDIPDLQDMERVFEIAKEFGGSGGGEERRGKL